MLRGLLRTTVEPFRCGPDSGPDCRLPGDYERDNGGPLCLPKRYFRIAGNTARTRLSTGYHSTMNFHDAYNAIKRGDVIRVRSRLEAGLDPNLSNQFGCNLLMAAAMGGNTTVATELIRHGASLDARDDHRWTALSTAAHTGHPSFVEVLLKAGASLDGHPFGASFEDFLAWTAKYGQGSVEAKRRIRLLIESARAGRSSDESQDGVSA